VPLSVADEKVTALASFVVALGKAACALATGSVASSAVAAATARGKVRLMEFTCAAYPCSPAGKLPVVPQVIPHWQGR